MSETTKLTDEDAVGFLNMMKEAKRLGGLTTRELVTEASDRLPLLGPDCLLIDEVIVRLRRLAAWEIKLERANRSA